MEISRETYIENKKAKIYLNEKVVNNSKDAILLIHGLAEHSGRYEDFISRLNEQSYSVFAMDLRGHGKSKGKRGDSESLNKVLSDVDKAIDYMKEKYNFEKVGIFGHSVGGLVSSLYQSLYNKADFIILSSPAIYTPKKLKFIKFIPYNLLSFVKIKKNYSESKEMLEYSRQDELALKNFSVRTIGIFFRTGTRKLKKVININCPTLLVYGKNDPLLSEQERFVEFMKKLTNDKNKLICFNDAKHRIVQNEGFEERIKQIVGWINEIK